ncbi:DUF502 domain-containing protein [Pseudoroseicyclus tamaricis]|uniref:DUF502 domain-containing protein n=1 Tax=Pseudoroseicyclus tamaricis TaxID=2705421 RepID=A0A6B2JHT7_9RHOB|nr:DUF502 domain-containing protein [Pseudoroseicyclus tamaricis]NDV00891.1 DUF502 domain-containing protein [Pseudoroseicyclus tamaricis]
MSDQPPRPRSGLFNRLRNNFLAGVVVIAPIGLTVWLIWTVIGWFDGWVLPFVPNAWTPESIFNRALGHVNALGQADPSLPDYVHVNIHGVGVVLFLIFTMIIGWVAKGLIGRSLISWGEQLVDRMPVVRSVYNGVKQIAETVFAQTETSFEEAVLVEYPRRGLWAIAFISTKAKGEIRSHFGEEEDIVTVFLPTTPNPTSGFLLFVPRRDLVVLDMSVEDAAKLVISAGLVYPADREPEGRAAIPLPVRGRAS